MVHFIVKFFFYVMEYDCDDVEQMFGLLWDRKYVQGDNF